MLFVMFVWSLAERKKNLLQSFSNKNKSLCHMLYTYIILHHKIQQLNTKLGCRMIFLINTMTAALMEQSYVCSIYVSHLDVNLYQAKIIKSKVKHGDFKNSRGARIQASIRESA